MKTPEAVAAGVASAFNEVGKKSPWELADKIFSRTIMTLAGGSALSNILRNTGDEDGTRGRRKHASAFDTGFRKTAGFVGPALATGSLLSLIPLAAGAVRAAQKGEYGPGQVIDEVLGIGHDTAQAAEGAYDTARNFFGRLTSTARSSANVPADPPASFLARVPQDEDELVGGVQ